MPRAPYQKLKSLYVMNYLIQNSDEEHPVTMAQILSHLKSQGVSAERKSVYDDIEALRTFGMDIIEVQAGRNYGYYVGNRTFQLPELKLLVDSIQSSKFITLKKTSDLIQKLEHLASVHEAQLLNRQVYVANRIKAMNESIYYNIDSIHEGITKNEKIRFHYFEYTIEKKRHLRKDGEFYVVSPYALTWDDENYYLVAYDTEAGIIKHYRVDKMTDISCTGETRDGQDAYKALDMGLYAKKVFGMFSGKEISVRMRYSNHLVGAVLDRFGQDVMLVKDGEDHFTVRTGVVVSPQFFAWISGFGADAQILEPASVVDQMRQHIQSIAALY